MGVLLSKSLAKCLAKACPSLVADSSPKLMLYGTIYPCNRSRLPLSTVAVESAIRLDVGGECSALKLSHLLP